MLPRYLFILFFTLVSSSFGSIRDSWVKNNLENLGDLEVGLLTGNFGAFDDAALRSNELNGAIFSMGAEALTGMMEEYRDAPPGVKGYKAGRVVLEVATILLPFTKAGKLMEVKKVEVLAKLLQTARHACQPRQKSGAVRRLIRCAHPSGSRFAPVLNASVYLKDRGPIALSNIHLNESIDFAGYVHAGCGFAGGKIRCRVTHSQARPVQ